MEIAEAQELGRDRSIMERLTSKQIEKKIEDRVPNEKIEKAINSWIHNERDRLILKLRLVDGYTCDQISKYLKANKSDYIIPLEERRIKEKIPGLEMKLFRHL